MISDGTARDTDVERVELDADIRAARAQGRRIGLVDERALLQLQVPAAETG
jgi:hypothetical protein